MTMITPSYLGETIEYSSLHACRSTLEDPTIHKTDLCPSQFLNQVEMLRWDVWGALPHPDTRSGTTQCIFRRASCPHAAGLTLRLKPQGFFERDDRVRVSQTVFNVVEPSGIGSSSRRLTWISDVLPSEPERQPRILWILAILLAPLLLVRFRNAVGGSLQLGGHKPNHE